MLMVVNLKHYVYGSRTLELVRKIDIYFNNAIVAVNAVDLADIAKNTTIPVYGQHVDHFPLGRATGYLLPEVLKEAGASGSLLNHSEHKLSFTRIKKTLERCQELNFKLVVCVSSLREAEKVSLLKPYAIAFEDPALIETGKSITQYKTHEIKKFVEIMKNSLTLSLCGAGISSARDVQEALALGCQGVLVASAIANSPKPEQFLKEIAALK